MFGFIGDAAKGLWNAGKSAVGAAAGAAGGLAQPMLGMATGGLSMVPGVFGGGVGGGGGGQQPAAAQTPLVPAPTGWGAQQPQGQPKFQGDLSKPGAMEDYWASNKDTIGGPSQVGKYWQGVAGSFQTQPQPSTNFAKDAYTNAASMAPADMSSYYDNAAKKYEARAGNAAAARGMTGNTSALNSLNQGLADLYANEAKDEAQYGLQRAGTLGGLARGADVSSTAGNQDRLAWLTGMGGLARLADTGDLERFNAGANGATAAQNALRARGNDFVQNTLATDTAQVGPMMALYQAMINGDLGLADQGIQSGLLGAREALNQSVTGRASTEQGIGNLVNIGASAKKAGLF